MKSGKSKVQELIDRIKTDYQNLSDTERGDFLRALSDNNKYCRYCGSKLNGPTCWLCFESDCPI